MACKKPFHLTLSTYILTLFSFVSFPAWHYFSACFQIAISCDCHAKSMAYSTRQWRTSSSMGRLLGSFGVSARMSANENAFLTMDANPSTSRGAQRASWFQRPPWMFPAPKLHWSKRVIGLTKRLMTMLHW